MNLPENEMLGKLFGNSEESEMESCSMPETVFPNDTPIAMAYIPYQQWETPYETEVALSRGTIFPSLDKPFIGEEAVNNAYTK